MTKARVMIVDDSLFSRRILADTLEQNDFEVVGEAESIESLIETYKECKPDIVTMDIAMPGADGFECSKALLAHDRSAKIMLVSSMKDEQTEIEAKHIGIVGYIQKPVDEENLVRIINSILAPDTLYHELETLSIDNFKEALAQNITRLTKTTAILKDTCPVKNISQGITVIIGIIGQYSGTMIFDLSIESAEKIAEIILRKKAKNQEEVVSMVAEFANIVGGVACSMINKQEKAYGLRVTPPSVFYGESTEIVNPTIQMRSVCAESEFGNINLSIGFKKEATLWM